MDNLRPCPFCGGDVIERNHRWNTSNANCLDCGAEWAFCGKQYEHKQERFNSRYIDQYSLDELTSEIYEHIANSFVFLHPAKSDFEAGYHEAMRDIANGLKEDAHRLRAKENV